MRLSSVKLLDYLKIFIDLPLEINDDRPTKFLHQKKAIQQFIQLRFQFFLDKQYYPLLIMIIRDFQQYLDRRAPS